MSDYTLICPFLSDDPAFAHGVEFGMLYARMQQGLTNEIEDYFLLDNQEQILLLANRLGWHVEALKTPAGDGWFWCRMVRRPLQPSPAGGPTAMP